MLTNTAAAVYVETAAGIPVAGFSSPVSGRTHRHQQFYGGFFCVRNQARIF